MIKRLRRFLILLILSAPTVALAQTTFVQSPPFSPTACDNDAINVALNCEISNGTTVQQVWGWSTLTLRLKYTYAAGSGFTFHFEECVENSGTYANDCTDAADWSPIAVEGTSSAGTTTLSTETIASGTLAATTTRTWTVKLNYRRLRLAAITATGSPSSGDKIGATFTLARGN